LKGKKNRRGNRSLCPKGHLPQILKTEFRGEWDSGGFLIFSLKNTSFFSIPINAKHLGGCSSEARSRGASLLASP